MAKISTISASIAVFLPFNFLKNAPAEVSQANVFAYVDQLRQQGEEVIMLDAGDMAEGQPSTYYYNNVANREEHIVGRTANFIGYDALVVGENDIQFGEKIYKDRMPGWFNAPLICANAIDIRTDKPMFTPYAILKRGGFKVAVLGLITPNVREWLTPIAYQHLRFEELEASANKWIAKIQETEKPDLIIGLFHISAANIESVIGKVSGLDMVLCGQDHTGFCDYVKDATGKDIPLLQPLTRCEEVGKAKVHLKQNSDGTYDKKVSIERVSMRNVKPSEAYTSTFEGEIERINRYLDEPLATFTYDLIPEDGLVGPSAIVNFIHEMQLWISGAEVSLTIIMSDFGPELKTVQYNYSCAAGINYTVDVSKPAGERVTITKMSNGEPFEPEKIYRVTMNDHLAIGGGGHTTEGVQWNDSIVLSRIIATSANDIRMNFSNYIRNRKRLESSSRDDWKVIPTPWFDVAAPREKEFLGKYLK